MVRHKREHVNMPLAAVPKENASFVSFSPLLSEVPRRVAPAVEQIISNEVRRSPGLPMRQIALRNG